MSNLDKYIDDLHPQTVHDLAAVALKIGYTYGGRFGPIMVTASDAHRHLDEIETILGDGTLSDLNLFTYNEDTEYVNEWRAVMGEDLIPTCRECGDDIDDGEGRDGMCGNCADRADNDETEGN